MRNRTASVLPLVLALACGCMEADDASTSVSSSTSIGALHPAAIPSGGGGTADSECRQACLMLDECGFLSESGVTVEQCIQSCELGYWDFDLDCMVAAQDCMELADCLT